ncbi:SMI1/KNR4 family protein, partial [Bacillus safensis]
IEKTKDEDDLYEVASTINNVLLLNPNMPINDKINGNLNQIAKFLEKNKDPLIVNLGEHIAMKTSFL